MSNLAYPIRDKHILFTKPKPDLCFDLISLLIDVLKEKIYIKYFKKYSNEVSI